MRIHLLAIVVIISLFVASCASQVPVTSSEPVAPAELPVAEKQGDIKGVSAGGAAASVIIKGFKFVPAALKIKKGTIVTWRNDDGATHTVESSDKNNKVLLSEELGDGDTFTHTFNDVGSFSYICGIHSSMKGQVIVE